MKTFTIQMDDETATMVGEAVCVTQGYTGTLADGETPQTATEFVVSYCATLLKNITVNYVAQKAAQEASNLATTEATNAINIIVPEQ